MNIYHSKHSFIPNKYTNFYIKIIDSAILKNRKRKDGYFELHHILPKSIYPQYENLKNNSWNGVLLTAREHFIVHKLLVRMSMDKSFIAKMLHAVVRLMHSKQKIKIYTSREYEFYSIKASKEHAIFVKGNKHTIGKKWYTNEISGLSKQIDPNKVPTGWVLGRDNFKKENNSVGGTKWYFDPISEESGMYKENQQPKGWVLGRGGISSKGKKSYYDPKTFETKRFKPGNQPKDWIPGFGSIMGENHWNYKNGEYSKLL